MRTSANSNPRGDADAPMYVAREGQMANGLGSGGLGIGRAVSAMFDWSSVLRRA
jgi:hypothetical protein